MDPIRVEEVIQPSPFSKKNMVFIGITIFLILIGWQSYLVWKATQKEMMRVEHNSPPPPAAERSGVTSRVTSRTIIAKPEVWSEVIRIPPNHTFRWHTNTKDCILVKDGREQTRKVCDDYAYLGKLSSLLDGVLSFKSTAEREVGVIVEWEPK